MAKAKDIVPDLPPVIDDRIEFCGSSKLREMNVLALRELSDNVLVIQEKGERIAILMGYDHYMRLQEFLKAAQRVQ